VQFSRIGNVPESTPSILKILEHIHHTIRRAIIGYDYLEGGVQRSSQVFKGFPQDIDAVKGRYAYAQERLI